MTILHTPAQDFTSIFDQLCDDLGIDPEFPRYVLVLPPRQRAVQASSFRLEELIEKDEPTGLRSAVDPRNVLGVGNTDNHRGPDIGSDPATEEDDMIDNATATAAITAAKDADVTVTVLVGEDRFTGTPVSVNSKGVNLKIDGKTRSFGLNRIDVIGADLPVVESGPELTDGMSTADVAAIFEIEAKELRVHLRKLGLGVGKGKKYGLTRADVEAVREHLATVAAADGDNA